MAFASEPHQFLKVLRAALADRVRKSGRAVHRKGDVLHLYETYAVASFQTKIEPCSLTGDDFTAGVLVAP